MLSPKYTKTILKTPSTYQCGNFDGFNGSSFSISSFRRGHTISQLFDFHHISKKSQNHK